VNKKEYDAQYYLNNRDKILKQTTKYRQEHLAETKLAKKKHRIANREALAVKDMERKNKLKIEVLWHYSNRYENYPRCIHCGFSDIRALSIDHINGNGAEERRTRVRSSLGRNVYEWLKRQNYPEGYQTLCMNCQWIKRSENKEYGGGL